MGGRLNGDGATARLDGAALIDNAWGRGELVRGRDYAQSVTYGDSLQEAVRFAWAWPDAAEGVRAYPALLVGRKPWGPETEGGPLPLPLARAEGLRLSADLAWGGETAGFNVALDLWLGPGPAARPAEVTHELMVWLKAGEGGPAGRPAGRLEEEAVGPALAGPLHAKAGHGGGWTYLALLPERPLTGMEGPGTAGPVTGPVTGPVAGARAELDLGALLEALVAQGRLPAEGWLTSLELGAEVVRGTGWLEVRDFALDLPRAEARAGGPGPEAPRPPPLPGFADPLAGTSAHILIPSPWPAPSAAALDLPF